MRFIPTGRIPTDTKQETRIYPLPHTYVVKDLVPDLTQFYKQYKSIKPYLQRETKSEDVRPFSFPFSPFPHSLTKPFLLTGPRKPTIPFRPQAPRRSL